MTVKNSSNSETAFDYFTGGRSTFLTKVPSQKRARDTFNRIVSAAVDLLLERGIPCLNTNAVAERADVNVASVYSYFQNKESILYFLGEYYDDARVALVTAGTDRMATDREWQTILSGLIDAMVDFRIAHPGCVVVRRAIELLPEPPAIDANSTRRAARALNRAFERIGEFPSTETREEVALFFASTVTVTVDRAFAATPHDSRAIDLLKEMSVTWLASYLPGEDSSAHRRTNVTPKDDC